MSEPRVRKPPTTEAGRELLNMNPKTAVEFWPVLDMIIHRIETQAARTAHELDRLAATPDDGLRAAVGHFLALDDAEEARVTRQVGPPDFESEWVKAREAMRSALATTPAAEPGLRAAAERAIDLTLGALRNGAVIDHPKSHAREAVIEAAVKYALAATPAEPHRLDCGCACHTRMGVPCRDCATPAAAPDLRARIEALKWPTKPDDYELVDGWYKHNAAIEEVLELLTPAAEPTVGDCSCVDAHGSNPRCRVHHATPAEGRMMTTDTTPDTPLDAEIERLAPYFAHYEQARTDLDRADYDGERREAMRQFVRAVTELRAALAATNRDAEPIPWSEAVAGQSGDTPVYGASEPEPPALDVERVLDEGDAIVRGDERDLSGWVALDDALGQASLRGQRAAFGWLRNRLGLPPYRATPPTPASASEKAEPR